MPSRQPPTKAPSSSRQGEPQIGIFWVFEGRLLKASSPVAAGIDSPVSVDSRYDHIAFWSVLQIRNLALRSLQYDQVPRGRILFLKEKGRFCVYMDKKLRTARIKRMILEAFALPAGKTVFITDGHYVTDDQELSRLFPQD